MTPERWLEIKGVFEEALALEPGARDAFLERLRVRDAELASEVASLLQAHEGPSFLESPVAAIGAEPRWADSKSWEGRVLGAYRVVEQIGEGGMGAVYRGVRTDGLFDRPVAVKAIRSSLSTEYFLRRFENERRILARLDHPNISRLLDGGATEEGVPYVVMEFVNGTPIDAFCASSRLTVHQRLELFRSVCAAVQYAHQNLIVHRDLKPANILVTGAGQPKLLDFGIAKILDPVENEGDGAAPTLMPMMTPEFASPEQVRGEAVTTASDVYSLGVILYLLLTGQRPYRFESRSAHELVRTICDTVPARPSSVATIAVSGAARAPDSGESRDGTDRREVHRLRRALRGDLDNIMLMALRKEASRRYQSAEQLSSDIQRYFDKQPIVATRDTLAYRSRRFLARHRTGVGATLIVIAALLTGMITTWREARIAQRRFDDVRSLANSLIFDVHDAIEDLPGSTAARKLVVERATEYLDKLTQESRGNASLLREVATGYQRIADVQGNELAANLGDSNGALASYRKALALRQSLFDADPRNAPDTAALAKVLRLVAHAELVSGDTANAWKHGQLAVNMAETATQMQPHDVPALRELREAYASEATILGGNTNLSNLGDTQGALAVRQRELAVAERIGALEPDSPAAQEILARSVTHMGDQLALVGRRRESLAQYLRARSMFEGLARQKPGANAQAALQAISVRVFFAQYSSGAKADALESIRRAMEIARQTVHDDPKDFRARVSVLTAAVDLTVAYSGLDDMAAARTALNDAMSAMTELAASNPDNGALPEQKATVLLTAADVYSKLQDYGRALPYEREAVTILARVQADDADNVDARIDLAGGYNSLGRMLLQTHDLAAASDTLHKALALSEPLMNSPRPSEESRYSVAESYGALGDVEARRAGEEPQHRADHLLEARAWYERSLAVWEQIKEPGLLSPGGYECVQPPVIKEHLDHVNHALGDANRSALVPAPAR